VDRAIVFSVLLLVALTWLLFKLVVLLEPRGDKPASGPRDVVSGRKPIHQRLRK
jgi:hypothetical protein